MDVGYNFHSILRLSGLVHPPGAEHSSTIASPEWPFSLIRPSNAILMQAATSIKIPT